MIGEKVAQQYFPKDKILSIEEYKGGAINLTYVITVEENDKKVNYKLQNMNLVFQVSLMEDIEFITQLLVSKNIRTPEVVRTLEGNMFVEDGASWWRVLTYLPGKTFSEVSSVEQAQEAGKLLATFHNAVLESDYKFKFKLANYHDVEFDMKKLQETLVQNEGTDKYAELKGVAEEIISFYEKVPKDTSLPKRIIHDDLKISNVLFDDTGIKAKAFIDVDTFTYGTLGVELGDAIRDWCLSGGEDTTNPVFNKEIYRAILDGYLPTVEFLTTEEKDYIPFGVQLMTLDLAGRFVVDAFNERYFNLDSTRYKNLFEQNKKKAENQLAFFKDFQANF